jgi:GxxExxY protein
MKQDLIFKEESYQIIGACFEVYNEMGSGFLENVYQECLQIELKSRSIPFYSQKELPLTYKGIQLQQCYKSDFIACDKIILELKAVSEIMDEHRAQVLNYLHATRFQLGLLVNFGSFPKLEYERIVLSTHKQRKD